LTIKHCKLYSFSFAQLSNAYTVAVTMLALEAIRFGVEALKQNTAF